MADNPFSVQVVNPLQALLVGQQAYKSAQEDQKQQALTDARSQAVQAYRSGDGKSALATLLGVGDIQGASAIGTQIQNDWTRQHTTERDTATDTRNLAQDAEHKREFGMTYGLQSRAADRADEGPVEKANQRAKAAGQYGLTPDMPEFKQFVLAGTLPTGSEQPTSVKEYNYYVKSFQPTATAPAPMDYGTFSTAKARAAATNITNSVDTKAESEQSKALGQALGKAQGADIEAGSHAAQTMRQLATLDNANKAGGDDVSSGPFGELVLKGKQGLNEIAGEDLTNAAPAEVIKKVGFGLATNLTKAITNRPAQMEFMKALENVPNLMMSKTGREAMTSIMMQEKRAEQEIGRIAARHRDVAGGPVWQEVKDKYYEEHPLISPFTGKPFSPADVDTVIKSVPGAQSSAPAGLTRADVEAEIRRRQAAQ